MTVNEEKIHELRRKIAKFEDGRRAGFADLRNFSNIYLNTADKSERARLAEEFRERHLELYDFLQKNPDLISAESEIMKISEGDFAEKSGENATNFFEIIGEDFG